MVTIDGSEGEGGGQVLRSALALSCLTGTPFRLVKVRANRSRPGLAAQHLTCVRAAQAISRAEVRGATLGSSDLTFAPKDVTAGDYEFAIGTAGATGLVVQTVAYPLLLRTDSPSTVRVTGGTHAAHAPTFDFLAETWRDYLAMTGLDVTMTLDRAGFYPKGGGSLTATFRPASTVTPVVLQGAEVTAVRAEVLNCGLPGDIATRAASHLERLKESAAVDYEVVTRTHPGGPGIGVSFLAGAGGVTTRLFALGERGKRVEAVADEAFAALQSYLAGGAGVDEHSADQIVLPLALAEGASEFRTARVTRHLLTQCEVLPRFLPVAVTVDGSPDEPGVVRVVPRGL